MRKVLIAIGVTAGVAWIGLLGAWAFNPDSGAVAHSELLWRIFGVPGEVAWVATTALVALLLIVLIARTAILGVRRLGH
jgi:hypothetical protein